MGCVASAWAGSLSPMFQKVLVANRGEIAVRAFRAAYELGSRTVAVFPYEDRNADHRIKAQESYLIGEEGHPVRAYLDIDEIIRAAKESGSDAIYPGYGFLSENPDLASACAANGITFIGPSADVLTLAGNKVRAITEAAAKRFKEAGVIVEEAHPDFSEIHECFGTLRAYAFATTKFELLQTHRDKLKPEVIWNIEKGLKLTAPPITGTNQGAENIPRAPRSLIETTRIFSQSAIARDWLGDTFVEHFAATREWEHRQWQDAVTDWELKRYFEII